MNGQDAKINFELKGDNSVYSEWSHPVYGSGLTIPASSRMNEQTSFSLVLDLSKTEKRTSINKDEYTGYKISLYENGNMIRFSYLNIKQWEKFKENCIGSTDSLFLGNLRNSEAGKGMLNEYGKMTLKNCRFYTRPLSEEEIKLNYDTRLAYDEDNS